MSEVTVAKSFGQRCERESILDALEALPDYGWYLLYRESVTILHDGLNADDDDPLSLGMFRAMVQGLSIHTVRHAIEVPMDEVESSKRDMYLSELLCVRREEE